MDETEIDRRGKAQKVDRETGLNRESVVCVREREADSDHHSHLPSESELSGDGHVKYGCFEFALPHSSLSSHMPSFLHARRLADRCNTLREAGTGSAEVC